MYYIKVVTNVSTYYWNDSTGELTVYLENATKYEDWKVADKRCEQLNADKRGAFFHRKKLMS